ncbi:MAG: hypothetical protein HW415_1957 [Deltaproteobacteria bacterium]|nr:hypothetical protein [Deltaproteobacteria bacterium]
MTILYLSSQLPLNPPFLKGGLFFPLFDKEGSGEILKIYIFLPMNSLVSQNDVFEYK